MNTDKGRRAVAAAGRWLAEGLRHFSIWSHELWRVLSDPAWRQSLLTVGALCGVLALIGVAYLLGLQHGQRQVDFVEPYPAVPSWQAPVASEPTAETDESEKAPPEVWTRMAGLNVWIAGRRSEDERGVRRIVAMLHGYGRPRERLLMLAEREAARFETVFLFPEAPVALDWRRRAWWRPRRHRNGGNHAQPEGLGTARNQVQALLGEIERRVGVASGDVILAGFSQGATLALEAALEYPKPLGGLALLSIKTLDSSFDAGRLGRLRTVPVLITHGRYDAVAPFGGADRLRRALKRQGVQVTWAPYDAGHVMGFAAQQAFSRFIAEAVSPPAAAAAPPTGVVSRDARLP